ncbi:MAG TPA: hypothetical protein ENI45_00760 [Thermoplasmatales archaeon]|nr:hypothetical protein [Thermoplasmatales archaeon]
MKKLLAVQITLIIVFSSSFGYLLSATDTYEHVQLTIVSVLCLSCIKLEPKTALEFSFETANGEQHPSFVLENLSEGPVLLHYRTDACQACDRMDPMVASLFNLTSLDEDYLLTKSKFNGVNVTLIHINLDHVEKKLRDSFDVYNILGENGGVPMFSLITLGYDRGTVQPAYATGYSFLGKSTPEQGKIVLKQLIDESVNMYIQNHQGYNP